MSKNESAHLLSREWDPKVPGLYLRNREKSSSWYLSYRSKDGIQRNHKLGNAKIMNRTQAREIAAGMMLKVAQGIDPLKKEQEDHAHTMQDLWTEYDRLHGNVEIKASTKETYDTFWRVHIIPHFGANTPVKSVTKADVIKLKSKMVDTPPTFNRVRKLLSHAMLMAEDWGWRDEQTNPCYRVKSYREHKRKRLPSQEEVQRLREAMEAMRSSQPYFIGMIELLILTGARRSEIMKSKRKWFQGDKLVLPDSKTGAKVISLNIQAQAVVAAIPKLEDNEYLIAGRKRGQHLASPKGLWSKLLAMAEIENMNMHDIRRLFASVAISTGRTLEQTMQLMGHTEAQTTKGYAFLMTAEATAAMQATGDAMMNFAQKKASG